MVSKDYDDIIMKHYSQVANKEGLSFYSTMADEITREKETQVIINFVKECIKIRRKKTSIRILDVGCGNGYTLEVLHSNFPQNIFCGIEINDDLRNLALSRFNTKDNVFIEKGDIREKHFLEDNTFDIIICQRVLINLLDENDQKEALVNIVRKMNDNGKILFIEAFKEPLNNLNRARSEFGIESISPPYHNLYLNNDFFNINELIPLSFNNSVLVSNFLSTHYYFSRVIHQVLLGNNRFSRNSDFVNFFSQIFTMSIGDYSPIKLCMFKKSSL